MSVTGLLNKLLAPKTLNRSDVLVVRWHLECRVTHTLFIHFIFLASHERIEIFLGLWNDNSGMGFYARVNAVLKFQA